MFGKKKKTDLARINRSLKKDIEAVSEAFDVPQTQVDFDLLKAHKKKMGLL